MATKSTLQICYSIIDQVTGRIPSDDNKIEEEWVISKMNDIRAVLLRDFYNQYGYLPDEAYQLVCCIEIACKKVTCNGVTLPDVTYYSELPDLLTGVDRASIKYLGLANFEKDFDRLPLSGWMNSDGSLWTSNEPVYTIVEDEAWYKNLPTPDIKYLCMVAAFAGPTSVCDTSLNDPYPLPDDLVHKLELLTIKQILSTLPIPADEIQDSQDNTVNNIDPKSAATAIKNQE